MVLLIRFFVTWNHYMLKSVIFQLWKYFWRCTILHQYQVSCFNFFLVTKIWTYTVIEYILCTQSYFFTYHIYYFCKQDVIILLIQHFYIFNDLLSSVQFSCSVMSYSLRLHELQHARPPCPSPTPGVHLNSCPSVGDAIQPSHPLSSPSPHAPNPSQH